MNLRGSGRGGNSLDEMQHGKERSALGNQVTVKLDDGVPRARMNDMAALSLQSGLWRDVSHGV